MESYSGKRATTLIPVQGKFAFAIEEIFDGISETLDQQKIAAVPFSIPLPVQDWAIDEREVEKVLCNLVEFSEAFKQFVEVFKLIFADANGVETQVADFSLRRDGNSLQLSIDKVIRLPEAVEPMKVSLLPENLEAIRKFIEQKIKGS